VIFYLIGVTKVDLLVNWMNYSNGVAEVVNWPKYC
jgi:hypothetical protein